jgi:hypothetical protein
VRVRDVHDFAIEGPETHGVGGLVNLLGVYLYVFICIYMYLYVFICIYMYLYAFICLYMYLYVFICLYMYLYVFKCIYMSLYVSMCFCGCFPLQMPYWLVYVLHIEDRFFNTLRL